MKWKAIVASSILLLLVGCKSKQTVVGTWTTSPVGMTFTFKDDNSFSGTVTTPFGDASGSGTYSVSDNKMTITPKTVDLSKIQMPVAKAKIESLLNEPRTGTLTWNSDDQFVMTPAISKGSGPQAVTFDRKKG